MVITNLQSLHNPWIDHLVLHLKEDIELCEYDTILAVHKPY